jgi:PadR family transcriptional regulator PadR
LSIEEYCSTIETKMKGGLFSVVVLHVIGAATTPIHGYLLTKSLQELAGKALYIQAGTLYPILKNLENHKLIEHEIIKSTEGPPRKIYRITQDGEEALDRVLPEMDELFDAIRKVRDADWSQVADESPKE